MIAGCARPLPWQPRTGTLSREQVRAAWEAQQAIWLLACRMLREVRAGSSTGVRCCGYLRTRERCGNFFDQLARARENSDFLRRGLGVSGAATAGLLAVSHAPATAIAVTAIGFGVADATLANTQELRQVAPVSEQARRPALEALAVGKSLPPLKPSRTMPRPSRRLPNDTPPNRPFAATRSNALCRPGCGSLPMPCPRSAPLHPKS